MSYINKYKKGLALVLSILLCAATSFVSSAYAEADKVRISRFSVLTSLALMVMEDQKLIKKELAAQGITGTDIEWYVFTGANDANTALLSGSIDFASAGVPGFLTIWDKTKNTSNPVIGVGAFNTAPMLLNTRDPNVHTIADLTDKDRIALPSAKVGIHALILQMAAAKLWGEENFSKLDKLTVTLSQTDSMNLLISGSGEITAHFASAPVQYQELQSPGIRTILNSNDVLGGPASGSIIFTTEKFHAKNPVIVKAFIDAYNKADAFIKANPDEAAKIYIKITKSPLKKDFLLSMINDPDINFEITPKGVMAFAEFMSKVKTISNRPTSWKELFVPEMHDLHGS